MVWDARNDRVWAVRDRAGVKPLVWTLGPRGLALASEAKALFAAGWPARWDATALAQVLSFQYPEPTRTVFDGIRRLGPGEHRRFDRASDGSWTSASTTPRRWFDRPLVDPIDGPEAVRAQDAAFAAGLHSAVARRLATPWPVAVHLSGGCDSTAIATHAAALRPDEGVHAFGVGFEPPDTDRSIEHDESVVAARTASLLGVPFTRVGQTRPQLLAGWGDGIERAESLFVNGHGVAKHALARAVHEAGLRLNLSGEGSDETLLGYPFLQAEGWRAGSDERTRLERVNPVSLGTMLPDGEAVELDPVRAVWGEVPVWLEAKAQMGARLRTLLRDDALAGLWAPAQHAWAVALAPRSQGPTVHRAAETWAMASLGGYILPALADGPEAGFGLEGRVPFLDGGLMDLTQAWPAASTGWPNDPKAPLRRWLRTRGQARIADRPKHPFEAPPLWGHPAVRAALRRRWSSADRWRGTPFDVERVVAWMDRLDGSPASEHQRWEPVVALLLSIDHLAERFGLNAP